MASSGILLLDKPRGLSSNAALQRVRALFDRQKAGHVGSLDPLATGMLPICLGEATKIAGEILAGRKCYRFTVTLGSRTATGDAEGAVAGRAAVPRLEFVFDESVESAARLTHLIDQAVAEDRAGAVADPSEAASPAMPAPQDGNERSGR